MHILFNRWNNTTEKNDDASEVMSINHTKINEAVDREVEEDKSGSDINDKGLHSFV